MKKTFVVMMGLMMLSGACYAGAGVSLDIASAYVFRGVTLNDGLVAQPGLEASSDLGFTIGAWGNFDIEDYGGSLTENEFSEIDVYGSYDLTVADIVGLSLGYCEYTYPNGGVADREVSLGGSLDVALAPSLSLFYGFDGAIEEQLYVEGSIGQDVELSEASALSLGATVGYVSPKSGDSGFSHFTVSAGVSYAAFGASVTYIGQLDDDVLPDGMTAYDVEVVGMLSVAVDI